MKQSSFGIDQKGREITLYTMENDQISISVCDYGATLVRFIDKKSGKDIVKGFDDIHGYQSQTSYIGASIGRTANRIGKGRFTLNGREYQLPINNNGNCNHGGIEGFDKKVWQVTETADDHIVFHYLSKDHEEGYPGNLDVHVTYALQKRGVTITAEGVSDQDTLFAFTNHSYFNLEQSEDVRNHLLQVNADGYVPDDENGMGMDAVWPVAGTPFDFRKWKAIGKDLDQDDPQLHVARGYDHFYPIPGEGIRTVAELQGGGLILTARTNQPGVHIYSANWLEGEIGKYGIVHKPQSAVCLECAWQPNAINYPDVSAKPVVKAGQKSVQIIEYTVEDA
ncbi:aldose epimerase family protein [Lactimicrobium sp.]|jgi:aldose 1-epimerase|uniref:aldose epimerase family protein n=1 Tax=Lactimicrobium sp. TaxID=2563780 RepID=UPI002F358425